LKQDGRINRFFTIDLASAQVTLDSGEAHHALHVLRLGAGAVVELFDGRGGVAAGVISEAGRGNVTVQVRDRRQLERPGGARVHLAFAEPKGKRLDWLLEKATELAATSFQPVLFKRSIAVSERLSAAKRQRWIGHCISAAKQSGLDFLPELREPVPVTELVVATRSSLGVVGICGDAELSPGEVLSKAAKGEDISILVGPEGGMTKAELAGAIEAGFKPVRLGSTTLRIETAAIALLAATRAICE